MTPLIRISLLMALLMSASAATALESDRRQQLVIEADKLEGNEQEQVSRLEGDVRLRQGTLSIQADSAVLHGPVKSLERLMVEGRPATLTQELEERDGHLYAEANRIEYDLVTRRLVLSGNAVVDQGNRRLTGNRILYDLAADRVIGEGGGEADSERVRIRIDPEEQPEDGEDGS